MSYVVELRRIRPTVRFGPFPTETAADDFNERWLLGRGSIHPIHDPSRGVSDEVWG